MCLRSFRPSRPGFWIVLLFTFVVLQLIFTLSKSPAKKTVDNESEITRILREKIKDLEKKLKTKVPEIQKKEVPLQVFGPGEYGKPFKIVEANLSETELVKYRAGYKEHAINEYVSDLISLHRKLDPKIQDDRCKSLQYPSNLPNVSVVIPFRDEAWSTLLRTVYGVLERSDHKLLKEIILVDDNSTLPHLKNRLDIYLSKVPLTRVIRLNHPSGLMMARQAGIDQTTSEVIIVMDSHVEVGDGWLEPLLHPIYLDKKVLTFARMDSVDKNDFKYNSGKLDGVLQMPNFDFYLNMIFSTMTKEFLDRRTNLTDPVPSPTVQGWMFAMNRRFFMDLGGFDPVMDAWGGEQMELSFKVWMCGGRVLNPPCSVAGHVYREVRWKNIWPSYHRNNYRVAEVWMDSYNDLFKQRTGNISDAGDVSDRKAIRQRMQCKSFEWYLDTIDKFVNMYIPRNRKAKGAIRSKQFDLCIRCEHHGYKEFIPAIHKCLKGFGFDWDLSERNELRHQYQCFDVKPDNKVVTLKCESLGEKPSQKWIYTEHSTLLHNATQKCLAAPDGGAVGSALELLDCDLTSPRQLWDWTRLE